MYEDLIFDVGVFQGQDTDFYLQKGFRVLGIEAHPVYVKQLRQKFKNEIQNGQFVLIDKAIAPKGQTEITFFTNPKHLDWGTILPTWNRSMSQDFEAIKVQTIQLEDIIQQYGMPYYLKIDIEGSDILCIKSLKNFKERPKYISTEFLSPNNLKGQEVDALETLAYLYSLGYQKFKVSDQSKHANLKCLSPALEGKYIDYQFTTYHSGVFGKELQTPFYTIDEVAKLYLEYFYDAEKQLQKSPTQNFINRLKNKLFTPEKSNSVFHANGWFDIHAYRED